MKYLAVIGALFGDEGKGCTTQWLCQNNPNPLVIRYSGGPQAAHTVCYSGKTHIASSFGSGVLLGIPTLYTSDVYVDPICMWNETKVLLDQGIRPKVYIHRDLQNRTIIPWDVFENRRNKKTRSDGTCGKGIYQCFSREPVISFQDFFKTPDLYEKNIDLVFDAIKEYYGPDYDKSEVSTWIRIFENAIRNLGSKGIIEFWEPSEKYQTGIFESSQGLLLDMDCGFWPHVTPSNVGLRGIPENALDGLEVYLVCRSYLTRHGNGYEPKAPRYIWYESETNVDNEFQGKFKTGLLEIDLIQRALDRHRVDYYSGITWNMVFTHLDGSGEHLKKAIWHNKIADWSPLEVSKELGIIKNTYGCYSKDGDIRKLS